MNFCYLDQNQDRIIGKSIITYSFLQRLIRLVEVSENGNFSLLCKSTLMGNFLNSGTIW